MRQAAKLTLTLLAGFALGAGAIHGLHAQGQKKPAYVVAEVEVTDPPAYQAYLKKAVESFKPYGAHLIAERQKAAKTRLYFVEGVPQ